ncbi:MAG: hypothetical protein AB4063_24535 [Crocosphaera sp.]
MTQNPRPSIVIDDNPTIIWAEVPGVTSYTIKIESIESPPTTLIDQVVNVNDLVKEDGFVKFMYPDKAPRLKPLVGYKFTGLTDKGQTACGDIIFVDSVRTEIDELTTLIRNPKVVSDPLVEEKWKQTTEAILSSNSSAMFAPPWFPGPSCFSVRF